jgi:hypothetical protein
MVISPAEGRSYGDKRHPGDNIRMWNGPARLPWHEWSLVVEFDAFDPFECDRLARRLASAIHIARTLDGLIEAIDRFADTEGLTVLLELEPRWDGIQDPNELRAAFAPPPSFLHAATA